MNEQHWLAATSPTPMLGFLRGRGKVSDRKLRLFACACCRRVWHLLTEEGSREFIEVNERYAEGAEGKERLLSAYERASQAYLSVDPSKPFTPRTASPAAECVLGLVDWVDVAQVMHEVVETVQIELSEASGRDERHAQSALFRDIFGNPFRPVALDPSWLTSTVRSLAEGIYAARAFDRLPILADALQDAGCEDADILDHCRGPGLHVRGCWVIDLVLGRS
jgi:hypothetical protein